MSPLEDPLDRVSHKLDQLGAAPSDADTRVFVQKVVDPKIAPAVLGAAGKGNMARAKACVELARVAVRMMQMHSRLRLTVRACTVRPVYDAQRAGRK